jgi:hypothetical protein
MDGNFSVEHMCCRSRLQDALLSAGMAFMADPELYHKHLHSGQQTVPVCIYVLMLCCLAYAFGA